jgi:hypothetical protein
VTTPEQPEATTKHDPKPETAGRAASRTESAGDELSEAQLDKTVGGYTIRRPPTPTPPPPPQPPQPPV